jgi:predicted HD phosphohydrolase
MMDTVGFTSMSEGTREDYEFLEQFETEDRAQVADNLLYILKRMGGPTNGLKINRYQHSLQTATRAYRDSADEETVVCALLHDIGDILAPDNHSQIAAAILRPFVSEKNYWIVLHHGLFQGYYYYHHIGKDRDGRERFRDHPHYQACMDFCTGANDCGTIRTTKRVWTSVSVGINRPLIRITTPLRLNSSNPWFDVFLLVNHEGLTSR